MSRRIVLKIDRITAPGPISRDDLAAALHRELMAEIASRGAPLGPRAGSHPRLSATAAPPSGGETMETTLARSIARVTTGALKG